MKKKQMFQTVLMLVISVLVGLACGTLLGRYMVIPEDIPDWLFLILPLAVVSSALLVCIVVHEGGHLVFGLLTGYRFVSFRVGSVILYTDGQRLHLGRYRLPGTGGQCLLSPPEWREEGISTQLYNWGGSLMNLICGGLFWGCAMLPGHGVLDVFLQVWAVSNLMVALLNGVPLRLSTANNDGRNALELRKSLPAQRAFWLQMAIMEQISRGVRLKDMPDSWFEMPEDLHSSLAAACAVFRCNRLLDARRFAEMAREIEALLAQDTGMAGLHRLQITCDLLYVKLISGETEAAKALYTREVKRSLRARSKSIDSLRVQYALALLLEGDRKKAKKLQLRFGAVAKRYPYPGEVESERGLMEYAAKQVERIG